MSTNETNIETLIDIKVGQAVSKLAVTLEQSLNRILANERQKIAQQTMTGNGVRLAEPTSEDYAEFAQAKLQVTPLNEIVTLSAEAQGLDEETYMRQQAEAARRLERE